MTIRHWAGGTGKGETHTHVVSFFSHGREWSLATGGAPERSAPVVGSILESRMAIRAREVREESLYHDVRAMDGRRRGEDGIELCACK
jgi:hypothetical protein